MRNEASRAPRLTGHLPGLDGVRGLAILMVMVLHFVGDNTPRTMGQWIVIKSANFGSLGVDLFFVLSGFLITGLLLNAKSRPHYFRNFYARRTLRIFPLYYGVLATLFLVLPLIAPLPPDLEMAREHQAWLWTYTSNFYIAAKSSWGSLNYVSHFWSLAVEEHFYLIWPFVVWSCRRETLERVCLGVIGFGLLLRIALSQFGMTELSVAVLTPCRVDTLCLGGLLALVARREGGVEWLLARSARATLATGTLIVALSVWCATAKLGLLVLHQVRNTLYAFFFGGLSLMSVAPDANIVAKAFQNRLLRFFGKYSYGLYVYHGMLKWYAREIRVNERLDAAIGNHALAIAASATFGFLVSTGVAVLSYQIFEKRFLSLKRFFESRPSAPASQAGTARDPHVRGGPTQTVDSFPSGTDR